MLLELVLELSNFIVEIKPYDISWFFLLGRLETLLSFDDGEFISLEGGLFFDEVEGVGGSLLNHRGEVIDAMVCDGSFFRIILNSEHFADDSFFENFNRL